MTTADYLNTHRYFGDEAEILGRRLDHARNRSKQAQGAWARKYWNDVIDALEVQWRRSPAVNSGQALGPGLIRWDIRYDFYESHLGIGPDFSQQIFDRIFRTSLDASWDRARLRQLTGGY